MDKYLGKRLDGRYEIHELIGVGGMANVYRCTDTVDDREVAVKILKDEYLNNEEFIRRFKNESKAIAMLSHPNIVKVYDVSFGDMIQYIVMEYIDGITLKEYIDQQGIIEWKDAIHLTAQILKALQHAHECGIVHRDIKPQNIKRQTDQRLMPEDTEMIVRELYRFAKRSPEKMLETGDDDFSFSLEGVSRYRASVYRQRGSLAAVVRVIAFSLPDPEQLGIPDIILRLGGRPKGLIVVTGPAGSGKSTTLACIIDRINQTRNSHVVTLEDPIEYLHRHGKSIISQREISIDTESYAVALRAALRQAPDVILLGEMRDYETISIAMTAAETGHLVISTLHTLGAVNTIDRIVDAFPPSQQGQIRVQLSMVLQAVVSQQLISCKDGRVVPAFEIMLCNPAIRTMIRESKTHQIDSAIFSSSGEGMVGMDTSLMRLYEQGMISSEEALLHSASPDLLKKRMKL